jgi:hypothetical protein
LGPIGAEPIGTSPQYEAVVLIDLWNNQIEPAIVVQIGQVDPTRLVIYYPSMFQTDALWVGHIKAVGCAVKEQEFGLAYATKNEIQITIAIDVSTADTVGGTHR